MKKFFHLILLIIVTINVIVLCSCTNNSTIMETTESNVQSTTIQPEKFTNYVVTADLVNIRKGPSLDSEILDQYYKNTLIEATTTDNENWYKIKISDSKTAFIFSDFIEPISDKTYETYLNYQIKDEEKKYGVLNVDYGNIRALPTTDSDILAVYRKNDTVEILATTKNNWFIINYDEMTCYVSPEILTLLSESEYNSYITKPTFINPDSTNATLIGTYSTDYSSSHYNREFNLEKAAKKINGMYISSNSMFNWCRDIGPCEKDEGYLESTEILNGEYVQGYGGGVCQVSSTISAAIITSESEFEIIDRSSHAIPQDYIPEELDATVSYPDCNFIFRNNNPFAIMIETICSEDNILTINIYKMPN